MPRDMPRDMLHRRGFLLLAGAGALAACGGSPEPGPSTVNLALTGGPGMNPGPDGSDRPVTVSVLRLRDVGAFNTADLFALQADPAAALGGDLVGLQEIAVAPGATADATVTVPPDVPYLGLVAMLRAPTGRTWRTVLPVSPDSTIDATVALGAAGMSVAT